MPPSKRGSGLGMPRVNHLCRASEMTLCARMAVIAVGSDNMDMNPTKEVICVLFVRILNRRTVTKS